MARSAALIVALCAVLLCACSEAGPGACPARARLQPASGWAPWSTRFCAPDCITVRLQIGPGGQLSMEGRKLGAAELGTRLVAMREMAPEPITLVSIDPAADCETIGRITHMIERITPCQGGYCYYGLDK